YGVFVDGDVRLRQRRFGGFAGQSTGDEVDQEQVVVGAAGDHIIAPFEEDGGHGAGVVDGLVLLGGEGGLGRFGQGHGLGGDDVHQRAALHAGKYSGVQLFVQLRLAAGQDQAAARAAQGLVGGGGDHMGVGQWTRVGPGGHQAGDVRHVHEQPRADTVGNLAKTGP